MKFIKFDPFIINIEEICYIKKELDNAIEIQTKNKDGYIPFKVKYDFESERDHAFDRLAYDTDSYELETYSGFRSIVSKSFTSLRREISIQNHIIESFARDIKKLNKILRDKEVIPAKENK